MKITIGIASYGNPEKLAATIESIERNTVREYRLIVWHNCGPFNDQCFDVIREAHARNARVELKTSSNVGYAGAVNGLLAVCDTDYFLYCDNDVEIRTPGWDEKLCEVLDAYPEVAQVFPGAGHYGFHNGRYHECLWNAGYCWALRNTGFPVREPTGDHDDWMDTQLGHHEEVDLMIRLRMAGYQIACRPDVEVLHHESSTQSPESAARIRAGVIKWMEKWGRYFVGDAIKYPDPHDPNSVYDDRMIRYTDWHPCALYVERWTLAQFPDWNANPRTVMTSAGEMDAIEILKPKGYYRGRAI